jgi:hypothetical protein
MIATHVSRPIRSASASGPIGCAKPSFAIVSIASGSATPSSTAYAASLMNGIRIRFETKPGNRWPAQGTLPRSSASAVIAAAVSSEVCSARITSTSFSTGTGLKKCNPDHAVGPLGDRRQRRDRDRRRVRGEDRVPGQDRARAAEEILLHGRVLDDSLDHQVGRHELVDGRDPPSTSSGSAPPFSASRSRLLAHRPQPTLVAPGTRRERDATAGGGHDLRDAAAHLARADDEDVLEVHRARG